MTMFLPSYAASLSGAKYDGMDELDVDSSTEKGFIATHVNQVKRWFLTHSQHLNFFTILVLASVSCDFTCLFNFIRR